jgi:hypothetical protein
VGQFVGPFRPSDRSGGGTDGLSPFSRFRGHRQHVGVVRLVVAPEHRVEVGPSAGDRDRLDGVVTALCTTLPPVGVRGPACLDEQHFDERQRGRVRQRMADLRSWMLDDKATSLLERWWKLLGREAAEGIPELLNALGGAYVLAYLNASAAARHFVFPLSMSIAASTADVRHYGGEATAVASHIGGGC